MSGAADLADAQIAQAFRQDFPSLYLGLLIATVGITALLTVTLRKRDRSPMLLWTGVMALLYGVRVLIKNPLAELLFDLPPYAWLYAESTISNFILIPALLFAEQIYGRGWRSNIRWQLVFFAAYGVFATALDFISGQPFRAIDPGTILLIVAGLMMLVGYLAGYRPPPIAHRRTLLFAAALFLVSMLNEHLIAFRLVPWHVHLETFGFFVLICAMGYVALDDVFINERNLRAFEEEMRAARRIQSSILPVGVPMIDGAQICLRYLPMNAVAGDFYEFIDVGPKQLGVAIVDVAGHGVPAALVASMVKVAIDSQSAFCKDPPRLLAGINDIMCRQARGNLITAGYLFLDLGERRASYAGAAHPPLLLRRRLHHTTEEWKENGLILGVLSGQSYPAMSFELCPGDRLLLHTDGISEAPDAEDQFFGDERLGAALAAADSLDTNSFACSLLDAVRSWTGGRAQADDITLIAIDVS